MHANSLSNRSFLEISPTQKQMFLQSKVQTLLFHFSKKPTSNPILSSNSSINTKSPSPSFTASRGIMAGAASSQPNCIFCQIAGKSTSTTIIHSDDKVVAFPDISPAAVRHYLVIPVSHIKSVNDLQKGAEDYSLVSHMLEVGQTLLRRDAPQCQFRFGFHQPPLNTVNHLHLHCLALPYTPRWKRIKFLSLGSLGFLEADKVLERLKPSPPVTSKV